MTAIFNHFPDRNWATSSTWVSTGLLLTCASLFGRLLNKKRISYKTDLGISLLSFRFQERENNRRLLSFRQRERRQVLRYWRPGSCKSKLYLWVGSIPLLFLSSTFSWKKRGRHGESNMHSTAVTSSTFVPLSGFWMAVGCRHSLVRSLEFYTR